MAKIYQTPADLERDTLKDQVHQKSAEGLSQSVTAGNFLFGAILSEWIRERKPDTRGWMSYLTWGAILVGAVQMVKSWMTFSKAHNLQLERERLGPENVVYPPDMPQSQPAMLCCQGKSHAAAVGAKTLLEHAQKTDVPAGLSQP